MLAAPGALDPERIGELGELAAGLKPGRQDAQAVTLYKSVGVGLEDVALAGLVWQRLRG